MANQNVLPLLAFQHHVGALYIDPNDIEFVTELGVGDLAIVEQGRWHRSDGKPTVCSVVVKGYKPFVISSAADFRELLLESSKLYRLTHPNITRFLGLGCFSHGTLAEVRESMFMVEEYVGTRTLRRLIGEQMRCRLKNLYDMHTALRWAAEAASALAALHEQQPAYIHGDVKSDNVFFTDGENLALVTAKLGDLKPHRHVYDQEPSMLTQHRERASAKQIKQSSLARFSLERSSCGSGTSGNSHGRGSCSNSSSIAHIGKDLRTAWHGTSQAVHQREQSALYRKGDSCKANRDVDTWDEESAAADAACRTGRDSASSFSANTGSCNVQRTQSMPVPIATRSGRADSARSCPLAPDTPMCHSLESTGELLVSTDAIKTSRSMPMPSCLSASEMAEASEIKAAAAAEVNAAAASASEVGVGRRRNRAVCLSDSASSTTSTSSGSARVKAAVDLMSLAAADDDDDEADHQMRRFLRKVSGTDEGSVSSSRSSGSGSPTAREQQRQQDDCKCSTLQDAWDCSAHGGFKAFTRAKSLPNSVPKQEQTALLADDRQQHCKQCQLATSLSAPAACCDSKVHHGHLMMALSPSLADKCAAVDSPFVQQPQQHGRLPRRRLSGDAPNQQQQQQQDSSMCLGWELSPSGAASPCGAAHSVMLDLFADMADEEVGLIRRFRDQYTVVPGSFVQQRMPAGGQLVKSSASWEPGFASSIGITSSSSQPTTDGTSSLKGGAPSAIESKQHGSNSAFAALTAIDCIREETSSIATDSVMGSCPPSREPSAHSGIHYYRDAGLSPADTDKAGPGSVHSKSPGRMLGLSALLPLRTIASSSLHGSSDSTSSTLAEAAAAAASKDKEQAPAAAGGSAAAVALRSSSGSLAEKIAALEACGDCAPDAANPPTLFAQLNLGSRPSSGADAQMAIESSSPVAAAAAASADVHSPAAVKRVRFTVERAAGTTPSRDISLLYAAPELLNGQRPTEKVDVFAFGVVLYELLSRSLLMSHCAAAVGQNRSVRSTLHGSRHGSRHSPHSASVHSSRGAADAATASADSDGALPEQQLLLAYAQMVAGGYRPPFPAHFPAAVRHLISSCWAAEPHERPRMADVLSQLQAWSHDKQLVKCLDSYLAGLADIGYGANGQPGPECKCGCVIC